MKFESKVVTPLRTRTITLILTLVILATAIGLLVIFRPIGQTQPEEHVQKVNFWRAPDTTAIPAGNQGQLVRYGRELIAQTSNYLGPLGTVMKISNGMNCQNCHLEAGTKPFGNNYGSVASTFPKFRPRSGKIESIEKRINDCLERSLNGRALDSLSREMRAMVSYIEWVGKDVPKGKKAAGSGLIDMEWQDRAANPSAGKKLYLKNCQVCHGKDGQGLRISAEGKFIYPPMWGNTSFNTGAGLFRISNMARFIKTNMPNGATYEKPILSDTSAWDIAAYIISMPRPEVAFRQDWPDLKTKPVDHPFGPYADNFTETQHKYGPFKEILNSSK